MMEKLSCPLAASRSDAKVTLHNVPDMPGVASNILGPIAEANIEVDMIVQNVSVEGKTDFTFTVPRGDLENTLEVLNKKVIPVVGGGPSRRTITSPRFRWSASACAPTPVWLPACSRRCRKRASTS